MAKDYLPPALAKRKTWYKLQIDAADTVFAAMGMTAAQITTYRAHCQAQIDAIDAIAAARANLASKVASQKSTAITDNGAIRGQVKLMKANGGYTTGGGEAIQIIDSHDHPDYPHYVPEIDGEAYSDYVRIKGLMNGLEQLNIYRRLKGTTDWGRPIASVTHPKFDDHSLPTGAAVYEYKIIGVMDDEEITKDSHILPVPYGG